MSDKNEIEANSQAKYRHSKIDSLVLATTTIKKKTVF